MLVLSILSDAAKLIQAMTSNWNWKAFSIHSACPSVNMVVWIINVKRCSALICQQIIVDLNMNTSWDLMNQIPMWICAALNKKINCIKKRAQFCDIKKKIILLSKVRFIDALVLFSSVCVFCLPLPSGSCDKVKVKYWKLIKRFLYFDKQHSSFATVALCRATLPVCR